MAYNYYPNQYYNQLSQQMMQMQQPMMQTQQTIQNSGFISVRGIDEARNYPVAPGNSVTFKDENAPYVYTKTMGFSQLDRPTFEVFKLVKEEAPNEANTTQNSDKQSGQMNYKDFALKADIEAINGQISALQAEVNKLKESENDGA